MTSPQPSSMRLTSFARGLTSEGAFDVLAVARKLKAQGKDVIELQIGDSPFPSTTHARTAGIRAIEENATHYCPSPGLTSFRETVAATYQEDFGIKIGPENVVVGPGAKIFEQLFCEAFLEPGDEVLVFSPHFPTYGRISNEEAAASSSPRCARKTSFDPISTTSKRSSNARRGRAASF